MLPHFSHYLHSNQAPSEDESREIKAFRINPLEDISVVDAEIERIETILDSLKRKRANIQKSIDDCNTVLAPVRRLPMDILGVIFIDCLATHRNPIMDASEAPILLTHICRDWRSIALSIPRLWSRMYIPVLQGITQYQYEPLSSIQNVECRMEARCEQTQRWLRLSGACPLSIAIMPPTSHGFLQPLLDTIIQSSQRWQQFELGPHPRHLDISKRILGLSKDDLCMLREIRIHSTVNPNNDTDENPWHQSGILTAQGLRSISIVNIHQDIFPIGIPPNWKNLHHLFIHSYVTVGLAGQILNYCCNLVACLLKIDWDDSNVSSMSSSFLPHLKFLSLRGESYGCNELFCNLEAPSLRILDCLRYSADKYERSDLFHFLQSINSLDTLMLGDGHLTGENALKCSALTPSLSHLVLGQSHKERSLGSFPFPHPHPEQVELMTALYKIKHQHFPDSAPTVLFPSLEVFEAYRISNVTDEILLEFIMARIDATRSNTAVSKLRKVLVHFTRTRQIDIVPEALAYARASGIELELDLSYYTEKEVAKAWSPSFGLSVEDTSWTYPLYDY